MELDTKAYLDSVCAMFKDGSTAVPVPVKGSSMVPFSVREIRCTLIPCRRSFMSAISFYIPAPPEIIYFTE